jgi:hypothetical protein
VPIAGVGVAGVAEIALWRIFPGGGRFPFSVPELAAGVAFCVAGLGLTWRVESARVLRYVFAVYLLAIVTIYVIPGAVGENVARLRYAAIPLVVLVFSLRHWQPRLLGLTALVLGIAWNVSPLAYSLARNGGDVTSHATTWSAAIVFLQSHLGPSYRVEAVDTVTHSSAVYLADAKIPLARGWYRQDDFPQNELLYDDDLSPKEYLAWLHGLGVRYVVLPHANTDYSSKAEAARSCAAAAPGLRPVFHE